MCVGQLGITEDGVRCTSYSVGFLLGGQGRGFRIRAPNDWIAACKLCERWSKLKNGSAGWSRKRGVDYGRGCRGGRSSEVEARGRSKEEKERKLKRKTRNRI